MNRIILIGNGFDLAHGLQTSYRNFIDDYWEKVAITLRDGDGTYEDKLISINPEKMRYNSHTGVADNCFSEIEKLTYQEIKTLSSSYSINFKQNNLFFKRITERAYLKRWVDIEYEFYETLKECLNNRNKVRNIIFDDNKYFKVKDLNIDFAEIKRLLIRYLEGVYIDEENSKVMSLKTEISKSIIDRFYYNDFSQDFKVDFLNYIRNFGPADNIRNRPISTSNTKLKFSAGLGSDSQQILLRENFANENASMLFEQFITIHPTNILFLNFNYTNTHSLYHDSITELASIGDKKRYRDIKSINIHGELNNEDNPIIFGFGDEIDDSYSKMENLNDNNYLKYIKSTQYHDASNYKELLQYIDSDYFQVCIFGHSCGLSDRTLLSTLFNHENCVSIKPYYFIDEDGKNSYSDMVRDISRHFSDKASLRDKVVNKTYCTQMDGSK